MAPEITETARTAPRKPSKAAARSEDLVAGGSRGFPSKVLHLVAIGRPDRRYRREADIRYPVRGCSLSSQTKWMSAAAAVVKTESVTLFIVIVSVGSTVITTLPPDWATVTRPPAALWAVPPRSVLAVVPAANRDDDSDRKS